MRGSGSRSLGALCSVRQAHKARRVLPSLPSQGENWGRGFSSLNWLGKVLATFEVLGGRHRNSSHYPPTPPGRLTPQPQLPFLQIPPSPVNGYLVFFSQANFKPSLPSQRKMMCMGGVIFKLQKVPCPLRGSVGAGRAIPPAPQVDSPDSSVLLLVSCHCPQNGP